MNFENLKKLGRAYIPGAKTSAVSETNLPIVLNEGALDVAMRLKCLKNFGYFDAVANSESYSLSTLFPRFLAVDEPGIWIKNGTVYEDMDPTTIKYLDNKYINWRGQSGTLAERYAIHGDLFIPHPYISTAISQGFLMYYCERPSTMSENGHFPFHISSSQTTERADLATLSDLILLYAEWKILKILSKRQDAYEKRNEYLEELELKRPLIETRMDISSHRRTAFMGPRPQ